MPHKTELDRLALGLMLLFCTIWGTQQVVIKLVSEGISPVWQAGLRSIGAMLIVLVWALVRRVRLFACDDTLVPGLLAGLLFAIEFAFIFVGLQHTNASRAVIFLYTAPFFVALGAIWLLPQENMRRAQWAGMGLAFLGVLILFGEGLFSAAEGAWIGDLMVLLGGIFWAGTTLTVKATALAKISAEKTLLYQLGVSAIVLPLLSLALGEPGVFAPSVLIWAGLVFQIIVVAAISYMGWFWLIARYPATRLSTFSFLTPVMGVLAGGLLLDEALTPAVFVALSLVALGIWVANRRARPGCRGGLSFRAQQSGLRAGAGQDQVFRQRVGHQRLQSVGAGRLTCVAEQFAPHLGCPRHLDMMGDRGHGLVAVGVGGEVVADAVGHAHELVDVHVLLRQ